MVFVLYFPPNAYLSNISIQLRKATNQHLHILVHTSRGQGDDNHSARATREFWHYGKAQNFIQLLSAIPS